LPGRGGDAERGPLVARPGRGGDAERGAVDHCSSPRNSWPAGYRNVAEFIRSPCGYQKVIRVIGILLTTRRRLPYGYSRFFTFLDRRRRIDTPAAALAASGLHGSPVIVGRGRRNAGYLGWKAMKAMIFELGVCVAVLGLLAAPGCGSDNESEAHKAAQTAGNPGAPAAAKITTGQNAAPPTSFQDLTGRHQSARQSAAQGSYPGASTK
jgi:hypothetical protein